MSDPGRRNENIEHQDRVFSQKALRLRELFDYGETFNDVTWNLTTFYHYRKVFDGIARKPAPTVLELGCHTGKNLRYIAEKNPGARTIGLDISLLSLKKAQTNNVHGTKFLIGPAEVLPFRQASVDAVLCMDLLEHLDDPAACLREAARVLREGGRIAVKCPVRDLRWTIDSLRRRRNPEEWRRYLISVGHAEERLFGSEDLVRWMEEAGFRVLKKIHFDVWLQNLYDYWFLPTFLPRMKAWLRLQPLHESPPPGGSAAAAPEEPFEIPTDPSEIARIRSRLRRRIGVKRAISRVVLPLLRLLCLPERLVSRWGIGATVYVVGEKTGSPRG